MASSSLAAVAQQSHRAHVPGGVSQPISQLCHHLLSRLQALQSHRRPRVLSQEVGPKAKPLSWTSLPQPMLTSACLH